MGNKMSNLKKYLKTDNPTNRCNHLPARSHLIIDDCASRLNKGGIVGSKSASSFMFFLRNRRRVMADAPLRAKRKR